MKSKSFLLCSIIFLLFCTMIGPTKAEAKSKSKPDKVEVIEHDLEQLIHSSESEKEFLDQWMEKWDFTKEYQVTYGNLIYSAYLSPDGTKSWIHNVKQVQQETLTNLTFPDTVQDAPVTRLGSTERILGSGDYFTNIFGNGTEPYHDEEYYDDTWFVNFDKSNPSEVLSANIVSVTMPSTVTEIECTCFHSFDHLKKITIPDSVTTLEYCTFYQCTNLEEVNLPANLKSIEYDAFRKCRSLEKISIPKSNANLKYKDGMILSKDGKTLVWVQPKLFQLTIPDTVKTIGPNATTYSYVTEISIPKSVTSIKNAAFNGYYINKISISKSNPRYAKSGNCIYSKKTHRLVVGICKDETLTLAKEAYYLKNNVSIAGKVVQKMILDSSFQCFYADWDNNDKLRGVDLYLMTQTPPEAEKGGLPRYAKYFVPDGYVDTYKQWYLTTQEAEGQVNANDLHIYDISKEKEMQY